MEASRQLGTPQGYKGYGPEVGDSALREAIAQQWYRGKVSAEEVIVSDGAGCDIGRLAVLFGSDATLAVQDPTYPAYVDSAVILGQTGPALPEDLGYEKVVYLPCTPENHFFPDWKHVPRTDLIYFCNPNNPTGEAVTASQLEELVAFAKKNRSLLLYDAAYASFIRQPDVPRSIFEIPGAKEVAIEIGSFSKMASFTGVRLGWTAVPKALRYDDGSSILDDWIRLYTTLFNGASRISQQGGLAALSPEGLAAVARLIEGYLRNADQLRQLFLRKRVETYGGVNCPYLWVRLQHLASWEAFDLLLEQAGILSVPGAGFGPSGRGFLRFSALARSDEIQAALPRLEALLDSATL